MIDNYEETKTESLIDGDFSCETTEDLYEPTDDELLYPSRHYDWFHDKKPKTIPMEFKVNEDEELCF